MDDKGNGLCPLTSANNYENSEMNSVTTVVPLFDALVRTFHGGNVVVGRVMALYGLHMCYLLML